VKVSANATICNSIAYYYARYLRDRRK